MTSKTYEFKHTVGFEETNLVGNVYYVNHLKWQGRCREMFLKDYAPDIIELLKDDLLLVTVRCSCDYYNELLAFDEIIVQMRLGSRNQNRMVLVFDYFRVNDGQSEAVARGEQEIACMKSENGKIVPTQIPASLDAALNLFA